MMLYEVATSDRIRVSNNHSAPLLGCWLCVATHLATISFSLRLAAPTMLVTVGTAMK